MQYFYSGKTKRGLDFCGTWPYEKKSVNDTFYEIMESKKKEFDDEVTLVSLNLIAIPII